MLNNVLKVDFSFWEENHDLKEKLDFIIQDAMPVPKKIEESLDSYLKVWQAIHEHSFIFYLGNGDFFQDLHRSI